MDSFNIVVLILLAIIIPILIAHFVLLILLIKTIKTVYRTQKNLEHRLVELKNIGVVGILKQVVRLIAKK